MRLRFITERLEGEGYSLSETFKTVIAEKEGEKIEAPNWNKLYFIIHKPKEKNEETNRI